jgi:hypothetical protein
LTKVNPIPQKNIIPNTYIIYPKVNLFIHGERETEFRCSGFSELKQFIYPKSNSFQCEMKTNETEQGTFAYNLLGLRD